jgi:hypothetical protein
VDVFADSTNHKCQRFLALPGRLAEGAVALDGLRFTWAGELAYVFPPVQLIPRVLQKIRLERDTVVMVVPEWPSRPWWNMVAGRPRKMVRLGKSEEVLEKGPSMVANRARPPPGSMLMVLLSFSKVTDERHRPGRTFIVEVYRISGMREVQLEWWFSSKTVATRGHRLHGWRLWQAYCVEDGVQPEAMKGFSNPGVDGAYFIQAMSQMSTPFYLIKEAMTAGTELFEVIAPGALLLLRESIMGRQAILAASTGLVRETKYKDIGDLTVVMKFVGKGPPSGELP